MRAAECSRCPLCTELKCGHKGIGQGIRTTLVGKTERGAVMIGRESLYSASAHCLDFRSLGLSTRLTSANLRVLRAFDPMASRYQMFSVHDGRPVKVELVLCSVTVS